MWISWLGMDFPVIELLSVFSIVVVIYLIILEFEFRQMRVITRKFDDEEVQISKAMRELKEEITGLKEVIISKKMR